MGASVQAIRASFDQLKPQAQLFCDRYLENLTRDYPEIEQLLGSHDRQKQKAYFFASLGTVIDNLDNPDVLTEFLLQLGERHAALGVEPGHYDGIGATLLRTLRETLAQDWSLAFEQHWSQVYTIVADALKLGLSKGQTEEKSAAPSAANQAESSSHELVREIMKAAAISLPESLTEHIRKSVEQVVQGLIQAEVQRCFQDQLRHITQLSPEELVRRMS